MYIMGGGIHIVGLDMPLLNIWEQYHIASQMYAPVHNAYVDEESPFNVSDGLDSC